MFDDYDDYDLPYRARANPTCNRCGKSGLIWQQAANGWRLYEGDHPHICNPPSEDDFDVIG
ncbi:hypothetical protein EDD84_15615 [Burkholderia gladioli]|nr:hypothetical protein EDD84_15615 [Burkholderia gladioli]